MTTYYLTLIIVVVTAAIAGDASYLNQKGCLVRKRKNNLFALAAMATLVFVAGFRYKVGADYDQYVANFGYYAAVSLKGNIWGAEPGIIIVAKLAQLLGGDAFLFLFLAAAVSNVLVMYRIFKDADNYLSSMALFLLIGVWSNSFNAVRQYFAAAICFAGYPFLINKSFTKWAIVVVVASMFHMSALIMLPMYFFVNRRINGKQIALGVLICIPLLFSYDFIWSIVNSIIVKEYSVRNMLYASYGVKIWRIFVQWVPIIIYLIWGRKKEETPRDNVWINISLLNAMLMTVASFSAYLARIGIYTEIVNVYVFPLLIRRIINGRVRIIVTAIAVICFLAYWHVLISGAYTRNFYWIWERQY